MASFTKRARGWRAQVSVLGVRETATFSTKAEAQAWALEREVAIRKTVHTGITTDKTLNDAFERYEAEVSVHKPGHRWETIRGIALGRYVLNGVNGVRMGELLLTDITPDILGIWRDQRMAVDGVSGSTVNRELKFLSHVFSTARREWRWMSESPTKDVRRPKENEHRDRLYTDDEIDRLVLALGFDEAPVTTKQGCVAIAFLFAIETAMRAGEITTLTNERITDCVAHLPKTKNGSKRDVGLSKRALQLLAYLPKDGDTVFTVTSASLDTLFRRARDRCAIEDATFHDTRHLAITRLSKKLHVLELARMVGHKDLNELQTYYNESARNTASKLD